MKIKPLSSQALFASLFAFLLFLPVCFSPASEAQNERIAQRQGPQTVSKLPDKGKRYALVIGVDEYRDKQINRLYGAANDARTLADALVKYAGFPADQVTLLATGEPEEREPTKGNILRRLSNLRAAVRRCGWHTLDRYCCGCAARMCGGGSAPPVGVARFSGLRSAFSAYRLSGGQYIELLISNGRVKSEVLGLELVDTGETLRLFQPRTKQFLPTEAERVEAQRQAEKALQQAESELARLRAELENLRKKNS